VTERRDLVERTPGRKVVPATTRERPWFWKKVLLRQTLHERRGGAGLSKWDCQVREGLQKVRSSDRLSIVFRLARWNMPYGRYIEFGLIGTGYTASPLLSIRGRLATIKLANFGKSRDESGMFTL
jgi:hypothetical protein